MSPWVSSEQIVSIGWDHTIALSVVAGIIKYFLGTRRNLLLVGALVRAPENYCCGTRKLVCTRMFLIRRRKVKLVKSTRKKLVGPESVPRCGGKIEIWHAIQFLD